MLVEARESVPDTISCPGCHCLLQMPEEHRGRTVRCAKCQMLFSCPATGVTASPPKSDVAPDSSAIQQGAPPSAAPSGAALKRRRYAPDEHEDDVRYSLPAGREFIPGGALALTVKILLGLNLFLDIVALASNYLQYTLATRLLHGEQVAATQIDGNDIRQLFVGIVHLLLYVVTAIVFLCWFHRVHGNLQPLNSPDLSYTSGWAVGFWFVPILNLYRPVQIAQVVWRNSDPETVEGDAAAGGAGKSALIGFWWAMWIISNIVSNVAVRSSWAVQSPESLRVATQISMVADVLSLPTALLAFAVVSAIDARQTARAEALWPTHGDSDG
jgi:hypothetical protein